jgi:hypothetical protein
MAPPLLTVSEWMDQLNFPDPPSESNPNFFEDFEPGDTLFLEGMIIEYWPVSSQELYIVEIGDSNVSFYFLTELNITKYKTYETLFFEIEIREPGSVEGSLEISGYYPLRQSEEPILVDIQKDHFSYKFIYMISGLFLIIMGILITFYWVRMKKKASRSIIESPGDNQ